MPFAPKRPCHRSGCPILTDDGYCPAHPKPQRRYPDTRESCDKRGYDYAWRKFRLAYLRQHPLCEDCLEQNIVTPATEPHHLIKLRKAPDRKYDESNLRALCKPCHRVRTARGE